MPKFRKKPVVIEARQLSNENVLEVAAWSNSNYVRVGGTDVRIDIKTLEGTMSARSGDWVIKGVKGEFYPCRPDIFEATYEPHENDGNVEQ